MVNVNTQTQRQKARAARLALVAANQTPAAIKVYASTPEAHAFLRHPSGMGFRGDFGAATEWPHDSYTHRRIMDGSISTEPPGDRPAHDPKLSVREAARAMRPDPESVGQVKPRSVVAREQGQEKERSQPQQQPQPKDQQHARRSSSMPSEPAA